MNNIVQGRMAIVAALALTTTESMCCKSIHFRTTEAACVRSAQSRRRPTATRIVSSSMRRPRDDVIGRTLNHTPDSLAEDAGKRARAQASGAASRRASAIEVALMLSQIF